MTASNAMHPSTGDRTSLAAKVQATLDRTPADHLRAAAELAAAPGGDTEPPLAASARHARIQTQLLWAVAKREAQA